MPGYHSNKINFVQFTYSWKCKKRDSLVKWVLVKQNTKGKYFFPYLFRLVGYMIYTYKHNCAKLYLHDKIENLHFRCPIVLKLIVQKNINSIFVYFPTQWELKWLNLVILKLLGAKKRLATLWDLLKYSYYTSVFR